MNTETIVLTFLVLFAVAAIAIAIYLRNKYRRPTDYKALFLMGAALVAIGAAGNNALIPAGIVFMLVGLKNREKWEANRLRWSDLSVEEKRVKIIFLSSTLLLVAGGAIALYIQQ